MLTQVCSRCVSNVGHIIQLPLKAPRAGHKRAHAQICLGLKEKKSLIELLGHFFYLFIFILAKISLIYLNVRKLILTY